MTLSEPQSSSRAISERLPAFREWLRPAILRWRDRIALRVRRVELAHYRLADRPFGAAEAVRPVRRRAKRLHAAHDLLASLAYGAVELGIIGLGTLAGRLLCGPTAGNRKTDKH